MSDVAISGLTALGAAPATNDLLVEVDVSDTTQAPTGTTKKMTVANLFTSPTMTGTAAVAALTASGAVQVTGGAVYNNDFGFASTGSGLFVGLYSLSSGAPSMLFDHRATSNSGGWSWGNGTGAATPRMTLSGAGALGVTGDFAIATSKFTVAASTGNTVVAGTLGVTSDFAIATNKFTVAAATGNTAIAGTLIVSGATATMPVLVGIGGLTAAFPALKRSGATLEVRAADDSGYTNLNVSALSTATGDVFSQTNVTASTGVFKVGANQVVGARSTGWAAQTVTTGAKTDIGASGTWTTTSVGNLLMAHHAALLAHGLIGA